MTNKTNEQGFIVLFEAPKIEPPEFRLYYSDTGKVITYTCEKLEGNYIVIDALTFAQARPDVRVVDGEITSASISPVVYKLMPSIEGQACAKEDISIVVSDDSIDKTYWNLTTYERNN